MDSTSEFRPKHGLDCVVGRARVPWFEAASWEKAASGWMLPGGKRTISPTRAWVVANNINRLIGEPVPDQAIG